MRNKKQIYWSRFALCTLLLMGGGTCSYAQKVVFPQEQQAGLAQATEEGNVYTLGNDLFSASFTYKDGHLTFDGCEAMDLKPEAILFKVVLGNGTQFTSSDMQLEGVEVEELFPDKTQAKAALKIPGKAIKATFKKDGLTILWRAILRDGSHYLRTSLHLSSNSDLQMESVTPMLYTVDNIKAKTAPQKVGNTRGAILISDKIFAGLETPMGVNSVKNAGNDITNFTAKAWTASSFSWKPQDETPADLLKVQVQSRPITAGEIDATKGFVTFRETGNHTLTFEYKGGSHRLNIIGVDIVDLNSKQVVAKDYHYGFTGSQKQNNVYSINVPEAKTYLIRYFMETRTETITSNGTITYNKRIGTPVVLYDLIEEANAPQLPITKAYPRTLEAPNPSIMELNSDVSYKKTYTPSWWSLVEKSNYPYRIKELLPNGNQTVLMNIDTVNIIVPNGQIKAEFVYKNGNDRLDLLGMELIDDKKSVLASDYHIGFSGTAKENNIYSLTAPTTGKFYLKYYIKGPKYNSSGDLNISYEVVDTIHLPAPSEIPMEGYWRRKDVLKAEFPWEVSTVVGLVAPGQARRSFLSYSERERAVPWRPMTIYNSWYELNIDRNNAAPPNYNGSMTEAQCIDVVKHWKTHFFDKYNKAPISFVWDDGWDEYGTWKFNPNFPNGFSKIDTEAKAMGSAIGAWLGPVGGYGGSGNYRRNYWSSKGGMQLSNTAYYKFFIDACTYMVQNYNFNYFKFDGISAQASAVGPDNNDTGYNNAEGIISIERAVRQAKPDIFFNTSVGTWASPFWFQFTDAVWRQEGDWGAIGVGDDREKWITYRDRLVYQNFVQRSPICPINTLMTHGFILTKFGQVSKTMDYDGIVREMRCAFACGSGMVELYADYKLMDEIKNKQGKAGMLWKELADCMDWQEKHKDILPDIHWVGGNPWTGNRAEIYGWAAWNGRKSVLTLRNGDIKPQTITITLREALDIPAYVKTSVILSSSFKDQRALTGLKLDTPIDIDTPLRITMPASSIFVSEGVDTNPTNYPLTNIEKTVHKENAKKTIYNLSGHQLPTQQKGINIIDGKKVIQ